MPLHYRSGLLKKGHHINPFHNSGKYVHRRLFTTSLILNDTIINKQALYERIVLLGGIDLVINYIKLNEMIFHN